MVQITKLSVCGGYFLWAALVGIGIASADDVDESLAIIAKVGPQGSGSAAAKGARDRLTARGVVILPKLLAAIDDRNIVAANWYRTIFDDVVRREWEKPDATFPKTDLLQFVNEPKNSGRSRRLALGLVDRIDPQYRPAAMAKWLNDPEFRNDAVEFAFQQGDQARNENDNKRAEEFFRRAFDHSRDSDQVVRAVGKLKQVGSEVDPISHMGFVNRWYLVGPFDAPQMTGFELEFPPEKGVDLNATYTGQDASSIVWKPHETTDSLGQVNLIQAVGAVKEAVAYAFAAIESPSERRVQLRSSADDNLTVWLNGEKVMARPQWLNGTRLDRFITPVKLNAGQNQILVKICQGPQHVDPEVPNNWSFQLRFCDESGGGAEFQIVSPKRMKNP